MKLEFLPEGSLDCPLLRLYDFTQAEAGELLAAVRSLASGTTERVDIDRLPFVEPVANCRLAFLCRSWDQAVLRVASSSFECGLTSGTWDNVAGLIEPIAEGSGGFQWLAGIPGEAALLLSESGQW